MINRENYLDAAEFVRFHQTIRQNGKATVRDHWTRMRILMRWADEKPFPKAHLIRPTFPAYLEGRVGRRGVIHSAAYLEAVMKNVRAFFDWVRVEHPSRYKHISATWVQSLRPSRGRSMESELRKREYYSIEDVRKLMSGPDGNDLQRRTRAAIAMLFLSGMRIGAFLTLPVECVDLEHLRIYQLPSKGVMTKNSKAGETTLLKIGDLLEVVRDWDRRVRARLPANSYWYCQIDGEGQISERNPLSHTREANSSHFRNLLQVFCKEAGMEYLSPHKFRHGFAVWAIKHARRPADLKAISQNLMHSNMGITDGIYGRMAEDEVHNTIVGLSEEEGEIHRGETENAEETSKIVEEVIRRLRKER